MRWLVLAAVLGCSPAPRPPVPDVRSAVDALGPRFVAAEVRLAYWEGVAAADRAIGRTR